MPNWELKNCCDHDQKLFIAFVGVYTVVILLVPPSLSLSKPIFLNCWEFSLDVTLIVDFIIDGCILCCYNALLYFYFIYNFMIVENSLWIWTVKIDVAMLFFWFAVNFDCSFAIRIKDRDSMQSLTARIRAVSDCMAVWSRSDGPDLKLGNFSFWRKLKFVWDWTVSSWSDSHAVNLDQIVMQSIIAWMCAVMRVPRDWIA